MKKKTTEEFKAELLLVFPELEVLGTYVNRGTKILVKDKYGLCKCTPANLLNGNTPSILSAVDKTKYFISRAIEAHGDTYDYSKVEYRGINTKVTIICPVHGEFTQKPNNHVQGRGCKKCGIASHPGCYNITLAERNKEEWSDTPALVYHIRCTGNGETFDKIGITMNSVKQRFLNNCMPYSYEIIRVVHTDLYEAIYLEEKLHEFYKDKSYTPKLGFGGHTECFTTLVSNDNRRQ